VTRYRNRKQHGFTLIEAIVALVLIGTTGMALFSWINSNIITLNRVQEVNAMNSTTINALEFMGTVNPAASPTGQVNLGSYRLEWNSTAATPPRDGTGYPFGIGLHQLAMYQTRVTVNKADGEFWFDFTMQQVGHKRVRELFLDN
jgi:general secretion pathway protein I